MKRKLHEEEVLGVQPEKEEDDLTSLSQDEIREIVADSDETDLYEKFGDELFTVYSFLLPENIDDLYELLEGGIYTHSATARTFIKNLILKEFDSMTVKSAGFLEYLMESDDIKYDSRDMSNKFVQACFVGDIFDFFEYYSSDIEASDYVDQIDNETLKRFEEIGITLDIIKQCASNDGDEDFEYCDELNSAIRSAAAEGLKIGAIDEAQRAFDYAFESALPGGVSHDPRKDREEQKEIEINRKFVEENIEDIWYNFGDNSSYLDSNVIAAFLMKFNDKFRFYEPRYGFDGFSKDAFNSYLIDFGLSDLEGLMEKNAPKEKEESLKKGKSKHLDVNNHAKFKEEGDYKMNIKNKGLLEAKADQDRFKAWAGEELFNRFMKIKDRLDMPEKDMTYWSSSRNPHKPEELEAIVDEIEKEIKEKENEKKLVKEGAEVIFKDSNWLVYSINNFEACKKYGAGTKWCITGTDSMGNEGAYGKRYWDSYTRQGNVFYFFLKKGSNEKFAVMIEPDGDHQIFDPKDREIPYIEGAPTVPGLPDVSENNPRYEQDEEEDDENNQPVEQVPPPYTLEPVQNPQAMEFTARTLEDALARFGNAEVQSELRQDGMGTLYAVKMADGRFTVFVFNGRAGGPLMTQTPNGFALVVFNELEPLTAWFQQNMQAVQVQDNAEAPAPQQPVGESFSKEKHEFPINTLQRLIDNAKMDYIVVYQNGDNQVLPTNKKFLDKDGKLVVTDGLILMDYEEVEDGEIIVSGAQEVIDTLRDWEVCSELNGTKEMLDQVRAWAKETFGVKLPGQVKEGLRLIYKAKPAIKHRVKENKKPRYFDDEPQPVEVENENFTNLQFFK